MYIVIYTNGSKSSKQNQKRIKTKAKIKRQAKTRNNIKNIDNVNVDLKFVEDTDRTWVYKDNFWEFSNDYEESQENSSLNTSSNVEFK